MSIKKVTSAALATAAATGVLLASAGGPVEAFPVRVPIIRCVPIVIDFDGDEVRWICSIVR